MKSCITKRERERERRIIRTSNDNCHSITGIGAVKLFLMHTNIVYSLFSCVIKAIP
jgi:hypothetical protein